MELNGKREAKKCHNSDRHKNMSFLSQKKHGRITEIVFLKKKKAPSCINMNILPWLQHVHFNSDFCVLGTHEHLIVHLEFKLVNFVAQTLLPGSPALSALPCQAFFCFAITHIPQWGKIYIMSDGLEHRSIHFLSSTSTSLGVSTAKQFSFLCLPILKENENFGFLSLTQTAVSTEGKYS